MEFNEAIFKSNIANIFVKIHMAIMKENLKDVAHFISQDVYEELDRIILKNKDSNVRQMYDELNVRDSIIIRHNKVEGGDEIEVKVIGRYMDYKLDKNSNSLIYGDNTKRIEREYLLTFFKKNVTKELGIVRKCPHCGASMDINNSGYCKYCRGTFDLENYDYILTKMLIVR